MDADELNALSRVVVNCGFEVHHTLGPGLLEGVYEAALAHELRLQKLNFGCQVPLPVFYKGVDLQIGFRLDFLVENELVLELKSVSDLEDVHFKQTLTYLRLANKRLGLLINFNVPLFKQGIKRVVNHL